MACVTEGLLVHLNARDGNGTQTSWLDRSVQGNNATLRGFDFNGTTSRWTGISLAFDGANDNVAVPLPVLHQYWSIEIEFTQRTSSTGERCLFTRRGGGNIIGMMTASTLNLYLYNTENLGVQGRISVLDTNKHHAVLTKNGVTYALYVDGVFDSQWSTTVNCDYVASYDLVLGTRSNSGVEGDMFYGGDISLFRVYNRALSEAEITQNYNDAMGVVIPVTGVTLNHDTLSLNAGTTGQLTATVLPINTTTPNVTWSSSNQAIATVNSTGLVSAISQGEVIITVTTLDGGFTDSCSINVAGYAIPVTGVTLNQENLSINAGTTGQLTATISPLTAINQNVVWSSSNQAIATVSSTGLVTAITGGTVTITATTIDGGFTDSCVISVEALGTPNNPFIITTIEEFAAIPNNATACYKLGNDIDASITSTWNGGAGFVPCVFGGVLDGNFKKISGLYINRPDDYRQGLFAETNTTSIVRNLTVENFNITGYMLVGSVVGQAKGLCEYIKAVQCTITSATSYAGGVIGIYEGEGFTVGSKLCCINSTITSLTDGEALGGIVGNIVNGSLSDCYTIDVDVYNSTQKCNGAVGGLSFNECTLKRIFSVVSGTKVINPIMQDKSWMNLEHTSLFYDSTIYGGVDSEDAGTPKTTAELKDIQTYISAGYDFDDVWVYPRPNLNGGYPTLKFELGNPIMINTIDDLNNVRNNLTGHYMLNNDIDASSIPNWTNIGDESSRFMGIFDGNNKTIRNLNQSGAWYGGMFGEVGADGIIKNLVMDNCSVSSIDHASIVATYVFDGVLENIKIINCTVVGNFNTGGISSHFESSKLCKNLCVINSSITSNGGEAGGLFYNTRSSNFQDIYSFNNTVSAPNSYVSGLISYVNYHITINRAYCVPKSITGLTVTPAVNADSMDCSLTSCYYDSDAYGSTPASEKFTPKTSLELRNQATYVGWDFTNLWQIGDGYPVLKTLPYVLGEELNPIHIQTLTDLDNVRNNLNACYILDNDIDATETSTWNGGQGWLPLDSYHGVFNGNFKTISNLRCSAFHVGFFHDIKTDSCVINTILKDSNFTGVGYVGTITAKVYGTIKNIKVIGCSVLSTGDIAGGLSASFETTGFAKNVCCINTSITTNGIDKAAGGLFAEGYRPKFEDAYAFNITVSAPNGYASGIIDKAFYEHNIKRVYCVAISITGLYPTPAYNRFLNNIVSCFYDSDAYGSTPADEKFTPKTSLELRTQSTYVGWDFTDTWQIGDGYPSLKSIPHLLGEELNPIHIQTLTDLNNVRNNPSACYILDNDIDASATSTWNGGQGWQPLWISGVFNGNFKTISNLYCNYYDSAFFSDIPSKSCITNLIFKKCNITAHDWVGLVAVNVWGTIKNIKVIDCSVLSTNGDAGGIATTIRESGMAKNVCCINTNVTSNGTDKEVGGLFALGYAPNLEDAYIFNTTVSSINGKASGIISRIYYEQNIKRVLCVPKSITGLTPIPADNSGLGTIISCYYDSDAYGSTPASEKFTPKTSLELRTESTFVGWDFTDTWQINEGYPSLKIIPHVLGEELNPIHIQTLTDLSNISNNVDACYILDNDIDASATSTWNEGAGWNPITIYGIFNGNFKTISNIYCNTGSAGFFYETRTNSSVMNLILRDCNFIGAGFKGILASRVRGIIKNIKVINCSVLSTNDNVGGITASLETSAFAKNVCCINTSVTTNGTSKYAGGLFGSTTRPKIEDAYALNNTVSAPNSTASGFLGRAQYDQNIKRAYCVSNSITGLTTTPSDNVSWGSVESCYYDSDVYGSTPAVERFTPKNTVEMKSVATFVGWNFTDTWIQYTTAFGISYPDLKVFPYTPLIYKNVKTEIEDMVIGDMIPVKYSALSGQAGTFTDVGKFESDEIPVDGTETPNGILYLIKTGKGKLVSDRVIQTNINWNTLNQNGLISGNEMTIAGFPSNVIVRSIGGGVGYRSINANLNYTDTGNGAFPVSNEWDKLMENDLGGLITAGNNDLWHYQNTKTITSDIGILFPYPNLIQSSNVFDSIDGFTTFGCSVSNQNGLLVTTYSGEFNYGSTGYPLNIPVAVGDKRYFRMKVRVKGNGCNLINFTTANMSTPIYEVNNPVANQWYTLSGISLAYQNGSDSGIGIGAVFIDESTANGQITELQEIIFVDLTGLFGAGNEPTKEWCDANIILIDKPVVRGLSSNKALSAIEDNELQNNVGFRPVFEYIDNENSTTVWY